MRQNCSKIGQDRYKESQESLQTNIGTDLWMAPEVRGERPTYGHPADVFCFGLVAVFLVTGPDIFPLGGGVEGLF